MSGKRYDNVSDESSSDEEYNRRYRKNSDESYEKFDDYENDCKILKKADTSSSSFDIAIKRGRGHSKRPCMNKNAQAARENRIRKKKHLEQVENKLSFYQEKNKSLVNVIQKQDIDIKKLKGEVTYLRCILKNNTNITALLQSMNEGLSKTSNNKLTKNKLYNGKSTLERITNANKNVIPANHQRVLQTIPKSQISPNNSHSESDHTYTIPNSQDEMMREDIENCENRSVFEDQFLLGFDKEPSATSPSTNSDQIINGNISETEMEEWSRLNVDIYDNFTNFNEALSPNDNLDNLTNLYDDSNVLEQFRDAGICLHINSEKVSLEFCSICHMNSLNSMPE